MNDPQMFVLERKRGGRPRAPEPRSSVSTWLPAKHHDSLVKIANLRGVSVSAVVRSLIVIGISKPPAQ